MVKWLKQNSASILIGAASAFVTLGMVLLRSDNGYGAPLLGAGAVLVVLIFLMEDTLREWEGPKA